VQPVSINGAVCWPAQPQQASDSSLSHSDSAWFWPGWSALTAAVIAWPT